ncbi:homoserine O-acetyltransferase [Piedraia hortae CBS 480.64]|uniref:Homoserine O-acetyltransferase n=1 Tax=Piedraia hortae CBS 480.64 TaxID=1314780 RepID=A0A6A7C4K5_9PEZI|nr:homoserine O-acetyltransferase [Piedraia hortae CBS 480.64]
MTATNGTSSHKYRRISPQEQTENPFVKLIPDQQIAIIPEFELESGYTLRNVPLAYKTYGTLSPGGDNAMVICHALTGSADVGDWWGPLLGGPGNDEEEAKAFDMSRFFVVCINSLGSPYGSASPVTAVDGNPSNGIYGPEFPLTTVRDDVKIFKLLLDDLGVKQVAAVIGGSMGGMLVLEFAYSGPEYVRTIVPIATSARYSAWGISWGEAQRQNIYTDPDYQDGYYDLERPPKSGLAAARMSALLTYRSRNSFETRFGRNSPNPVRQQTINGYSPFAIHNEGHRKAGSPRPRPSIIDAQFSSTATPLPTPPPSAKRISTYYSANSYMRYQGEKFTKRFDANCYIAITRKLDTHDVARGRTSSPNPTQDEINAVLGTIQQPTLVLGIQSDGLFTYDEQQQLSAAIPRGELQTIHSPEGHDAFLLEFKQVNKLILDFLRRELPDLMKREPVLQAIEPTHEAKTSTFGEAEVGEITAW